MLALARIVIAAGIGEHRPDTGTADGVETAGQRRADLQQRRRSGLRRSVRGQQSQGLRCLPSVQREAHVRLDDAVDGGSVGRHGVEHARGFRQTTRAAQRLGELLRTSTGFSRSCASAQARCAVASEPAASASMNWVLALPSRLAARLSRTP